MLRTKNYFYSIFFIFFPCLLGVLAMYSNNVAMGIWIRNISAIILMCLISIAILKYMRSDIKLNYKVITSIGIFLLIIPFFQSGNMEVHRWINISAISLNVSMLAGFTFAMLFCLFNKENRNNTNTIVKIITSLILIIFTVLAWNLSDNLQPVSYTEEILLMLKDISSVLYVLGIISLFLIPIPVIVFSKKSLKTLSFCIALYYWIIVISTFFGDFPVPFMGYGISPIIGYFIVLIFFVKHTEIQVQKK